MSSSVVGKAVFGAASVGATASADSFGSLSITENIDNFSDRVLLLLDGTKFFYAFTEDTNNYSDILAIINNFQKAIAEDTNNYADALTINQSINYTLTITENSNNYLDAFARFFPSIHFSDNINNFADAISRAFAGALLVEDSIPAIRDSITPFIAKILAIAETNGGNFSDAISSVMSGSSIFSPSDNVGANLGDSVNFVFGLELNLHDALHIHDELDLTRASILNLSDSINHLSDAINIPGLNQLQLQIVEDLDNFYDSVYPGFSRPNPVNRSSNLSYIRRYLNDKVVS